MHDVNGFSKKKKRSRIKRNNIYIYIYEMLCVEKKLYKRIVYCSSYSPSSTTSRNFTNGTWWT